MKISDLKLGQKIIINGHEYSYDGVQKIRKSGYKIQQIVFKSTTKKVEKHFDITMGSKELDVHTDQITLK